MNDYGTKNIRNLCVLGHSGSGKTSLTEAILYIGQGSDRLGKVADGKASKIFLPLETSGVTASLAGIAELFKDKKENIGKSVNNNTEINSYMNYTANHTQKNNCT